jgi:type 1 glutamine amidotransferase
LLAIGFSTFNAVAADKKIVFIAGKPSHGPGQHEHRAGCLLLQSCLKDVPGVTSVVYSNGWPAESSALDDAAAIVVYSDGGGGHPLLQADRLKTIGALMDKGVGLVCIHYGVEPTKDKGQKEFLDWMGGAFEINWSVNPHWDADFKALPNHPITRGVKPFKIRDEWYFNMRFREGMKGVTPILSAVPDASTTNRNNGPHEGNPAMREMVARGDAQHVAWAAERADGGRGFGFTGGHFHQNWGDDNFRKVMLNAILWTAKVEVPAEGVQSTVTPEQLAENLDPKGRRQ